MCIMSFWVFNLLSIIINMFTFFLLFSCNYFIMCIGYKHANKIGFGNWMIAPPPRLEQPKPTWGCPGRGGGAFSVLPFPNSESVCSFTFTRGQVRSQAFQTQLSEEIYFFLPWADRKGNKSWIYFLLSGLWTFYKRYLVLRNFFY